jgi:hypothetical protein
MGIGWFCSSLCGTVWSIEPLLNHTLGLIQHNWVVLAYNFNVVILVLIIGESSIDAFLLILLLRFYSCYYLALSFYSYTCRVPTISWLNFAIFPLLLKHVAQKERMEWNSSMRSSRLRVAPVVVPVELWSLPLFHIIESCLSLWDIIYVIIIYILDIWLSVNTFGRMCGTIDPGSCIRWVLGFDIKTGYDRGLSRTYTLINYFIQTNK